MDKKKTSRLRLVSKNPKVSLGLYLFSVGVDRCSWEYIKHSILIFLRGVMEVLGVHHDKTH